MKHKMCFFFELNDMFLYIFRMLCQILKDQNGVTKMADKLDCMSPDCIKIWYLRGFLRSMKISKVGWGQILLNIIGNC